jgi:hypothetical protein
MSQVKCKKITYEALGQKHIAYADEFYTMKEAQGLIKQICDTAKVFKIENEIVSDMDYKLNCVSKIAQFIDDVEQFDKHINYKDDE